MITYIAIDQHGAVHKLYTKHPRKELLNMFCRQHADIMYIDTKAGTKKCGYIIGGLWLTLYKVTPVLKDI